MGNKINYNTINQGRRKNRIYIKALKSGIYDTVFTRQKREEYLKVKNGPDIGLRGKFIQIIENSDLGIEEDIENFIRDNNAFSKDDLTKWIREELKRGKVSEKTLHKIELYLRNVEQRKIKESDDNAR